MANEKLASESLGAPSIAAIEAFVERVYGLTTECKPLAGEVDLNFRLRGRGGASDQRFVFKLVDPDTPEGDLDLQEAVLRHLADTGSPLDTPVPVASLAGETRVELAATEAEGSKGQTWRGRLLTFVPGRFWVDLEHRGPKLHHHLGERLAHLDQALASFPVADDLVRDWQKAEPSDGAGDWVGQEQWDLSQAHRHRAALGSIPDPVRRRRAETTLHRFSALVRPALAELPVQVIHNDANDHNLLVDDSGERVVGLIDFGDLTVNPRVTELAIAIAYAVLGEDDPLAVAAAVTAGYHSATPLETREIELVVPLAAARLAVSVTISAGRRAEGLDDPYLYVTEEPAWRALETLADVDPAAAFERLAKACGLAPREPRPDAATLSAARSRRIGPSLSVSYREPLAIVRGRGQYLYDERGRPFLDLVNNVCHVGHCHPRVVAAGQAQMARLNTNTRYLYPQLTDYADRLAATLPDPLEVCFFVTSGSEANELALRLARTVTGRHALLVHEGAYHGHTNTLIDISPYKFLRAGGRGEALPWVHMVPMPDGYRGKHRGRGPETGAAYGEEVGRVLAGVEEPVAAFIAEPILGCGGQIVPPPGYLQTAYAHARKHGALCIADEVQVGFGRMGSHFWSFASQDVVPDVVVLGKPIGNGHPMAAVVTTREIAERFANGMEFFSTFGGNPVSCAIGMAVLDVVADEGLQERAAELGRRMIEGFEALAQRHDLIGEVRGRGLFVGVELVRDHRTLEPADREARQTIDALKERGILVSTDGPLDNVLKIKPPMVLDADDVDFVIRSLDDVLAAL